MRMKVCKYILGRMVKGVDMCCTQTSTPCYVAVYNDVAEEMFSVQAAFPSQYKYGCKKFKRLNNCIERDLSRYGRDDAITGNCYKDEQRKEAYDILDRVEMSIPMDKSIIQVTKLQFHKFREKCTEFKSLKWHCVVCCILHLMRTKQFSFACLCVFLIDPE